MSEDDPRTAGDYVRKMFAAIERGDIEEMKTCFVPDAIVWHNFDQVEQSVEESAEVQARTRDLVNSITYKEVRIDEKDDLCFAQFVAAVEFKTGKTLDIPGLMRIQGAPDGRIKRIDEYVDSGALADLL